MGARTASCRGTGTGPARACVSLVAGFEFDLISELSDEERDQLLELLQRVGAQLGLPGELPVAHPAVTEE
jgi:hypothetical protein